FRRYNEITMTDKKVIFGGRLAEYRYYDMHQVIRSAFNKFEQELGRK
ncbi:UDP-galactopyranose mutase, partial [Escherichia coli]|nr:UDP-galactopyranose mutase [Escherichia coli]